MSDVITREQYDEAMINYVDADDEYDKALRAHDAALRQRVEELETDLRSRTEDWQLSEKLLHESKRQLAQSEEMNTGLAASQCDDPIAGAFGHWLCGRVMELERRLAHVTAERDELHRQQCVDQYELKQLDLKLAEREAEVKATHEAIEIRVQYVQGLLTERDGTIARLTEHQELHDRIFARQKLLMDEKDTRLATCEGALIWLAIELFSGAVRLYREKAIMKCDDEWLLNQAARARAALPPREGT